MPTDFEPITYRDDLSHYLINRKGEVYSTHTNKPMTPVVDRSGYLTYVLTSDEGKKVKWFAHIGVAKEFIPNPDPEHKTYVNHIDENKRNPAIDNLEWVTPIENANHGSRNDRIKRHNHKPVNEYDLDGQYIRTWASTRSIVEFFADFFGKTLKDMQSCENSIHGCLKGRSKTSMNRIWRYYEGNTDNIKSAKGTKNEVGISHSPSKTRFDYPVDVPAEYLYHDETDQEIYDYFMALDKLTDYEKAMLTRFAEGNMGVTHLPRQS